MFVTNFNDISLQDDPDWKSLGFTLLDQISRPLDVPGLLTDLPWQPNTSKLIQNTYFEQLVG